MSIASLTHWGWITHIFVSKQIIVGSYSGLSPGRHQAIFWNKDGTNFSEILVKIILLVQKMHLKMSSGNWRPICLGLNVLIKETIIHVIKSTNLQMSRCCKCIFRKTGWRSYSEKCRSGWGHAFHLLNPRQFALFNCMANLDVCSVVIVNCTATSDVAGVKYQ